MAVATSPARPRANTSRIFIIVGAALAALAFILIFFLGSLGHGGVGSTGGTTNIVVAARDIPFRSALTRDDLKVQAWNGDVPPGAYKSIDDVIGKGAAQASPGAGPAVNATGAVAEIKISQGQPITQNMLANSIDAVQVQPAYLPIPKGFEAATIPTSEQTGVAGYIQAGDYINILASANVSVFSQQGQQQGPPRSVTKTVFTNVHVLKVGAATGQVTTGGQPASSQTGGVASSLTLVMTQCDWEFLRWLQANATLTYTLGSYQDYKPQDTKPDPTCQDATAAHGVGPASADKRWNFSGTQ
ncbi:MAG TPA: Flp pilus assembly protein CpaB [Candidatus Dormibacteraeota bacterium]